MTRFEMTAILTLLAASYRDFPVIEARVEAWMIACGHHSIEQVKTAALQYMAKEGWPPTPAHINRIIGGSPRPSVLIWAKIQEHEGSQADFWKKMEVLQPNDLATAYTIRVLGGWDTIKHSMIHKKDDLEYLRKDFCKYRDQMQEYKDNKDASQAIKEQATKQTKEVSGVAQDLIGLAKVKGVK